MITSDDPFGFEAVILVDDVLCVDSLRERQK